MAGRLTMSSKDSRQELEQNATIIFMMFLDDACGYYYNR